MEAIFRNPGRQIDYTNGATAIAAGDVVVLGTVPMVAERDIAALALGALTCEGIFEVLKGGEGYTAGDAVYWDEDGTPTGGTGTGCASGTASTGNLMGFAAYDAATGDTRVSVKLTAAKRTATIAGSVTADDITGSDSSLGINGVAAAQGGAIVVTGGTSSTAGNAGGAVGLVGGVPGITGAGGVASVVGGIGGATSGAGGVGKVVGGAGTGTNANGGAAQVTGGAAKGTGTGGAVTIAAGASEGATGTAGAVSIDAGAATGGTGAGVSIGTSNATSVTIGKASVATVMPGPRTRAPGASTAAAGTTSGDCATLPAGTASVYPVTAADDAAGVKPDAADKVTGRIIMIGNCVSNKVLKVYPYAGGTVNGAGANVAFSSVSGKGVTLYCLDSTANTWLAW